MTEITGQCPAHRANTQGRDSYSWNPDKKVGSCLSCGLRTTIGAKGDLIGHYGDKRWFVIEEGSEGAVRASEEVEEYTGEIVEDKNVFSYKAHRGITQKTMEYFGVQHGTYKKWQVKKGDKVVDSGVSRDFYRFPYPNGAAKVRHEDLPKKHKGHFGNMDGLIQTTELFGQTLFPRNGKFITVFEGEYDCMAGAQMLFKPSYGYAACVSLAGSNISDKAWDKDDKSSIYNYLNSFEQIILCIDQDSAGDIAAAKFRGLFPNKIKRVKMGNYKDANEMLEKGKVQEFVGAWWNAVNGPVYSPEGTFVSPEDYLQLYEETPNFQSFKTDIPELDAKMLGISKGYMTLIQAPTGLGKSEVMRYIEWKCLQNSSYKFASCRKEETQGRSLLGLVCYDIKENVTLKQYIDEKGLDSEVRGSIVRLTKDGRFITISIDDTKEVKEILEELRYYVAAHNVDFFFLEPIQDIISGTNSSDKEGKISLLISGLETIIKETGIGVVVIAHQNNDGGAMYSSMITKKAGFKIVLKADRNADDKDERNKTYLFVEEKNRSGGGFGPAGVLTFDYDSYTLEPSYIEEPKVESKTVKDSKGKEEEIPF